MSKWIYPMTEKAQSAMRAAEKSAVSMKHGYIGSEHILLGLLRTDCSAAELLRQQHVTEERVEDLIRRLIGQEAGDTAFDKPELTPKAKELLRDAMKIAEELGEQAVSTDHMLLSMSRQWDDAAVRLLNTMEIDRKKLNSDLAVTMGAAGRILRDEGEETGGRTDTLDAFSRDLTELAASGKLDPVIGREKELMRLLQILSRRTKNNPCLIGEPGVGKTAIVEALAARMASGNVPDDLRGKRLMALDLSAMVAGTKYRGEFEERIKKVISEVSGDGQVLLFLDEIHTLIGAGGAEGALDAANILKPALSRGEIQLIGATTVDEYRKHIEKDPALERRFQPVMVEEPSQTETVEILRGLRPKYEQHHHVQIEEEALVQAAALSARYIHDRFLPDKALDLIDEAAAHVRLRGSSSKRREETEQKLRNLEERREQAIMSGAFSSIPELQEEHTKLMKQLQRMDSGSRRPDRVTGEDVAEVVAGWTGIPLKKLGETDQARLRNLEKTLHQRVVGQEEAVTAVARAIRRGRLGLKNPSRPVGSFLFLGPTGVGKTELSKALTEAMFGQESALIRVDMSEYMEKHSVSRMIGSPPGYVGYEEGGQLSEKVRRNPYSVILFDEIEKAHPDVFNVLLQILDEGHVTDSQGRKIDFRNTILIMTSNAGAERIVEPKHLGFAAVNDAKADHERMKNNVMEEVRRIFRPEFLNRIDEIQVFHALTKEDMKQIFRILWKQLGSMVKDAQNLTLTITPEARDWLVDQGFEPKYGARPLKRKFRTELEDPLADAVLGGSLKPGDEVRITLADKKLKFSPVKKREKKNALSGEEMQN